MAAKFILAVVLTQDIETHHNNNNNNKTTR
jgi:hypothetical protein